MVLLHVLKEEGSIFRLLRSGLRVVKCLECDGGLGVGSLEEWIESGMHEWMIDLKKSMLRVKFSTVEQCVFVFSFQWSYTSQSWILEHPFLLEKSPESNESSASIHRKYSEIISFYQGGE